MPEQAVDGALHVMAPSETSEPALGGFHDKLGLRDRKKQRTYNDLEWSALQLVREVGYEATTTDAISARANVSTRTFFNYFSSKDDAILGVHTDGFEGVQIEETFSENHSGNAVEDCTDALVALLIPRISPPHFRIARRDICRQIPHLRDRQIAKMSQFRAALSSLIATDLVSESAGTYEPRTAVLASMIVDITMTALRAVVDDAGENTPSADEVRRRTVALVRRLGVELR